MKVRYLRLLTTTAAAVTAIIGIQSASAQTYSGEAAVIDITDLHHPSPAPIIIADTGELDSSGGLLFDFVSSTNVYDGALTLQDGTALSAGFLTGSASEASLQNLTIEFTDMSADGIVHVLTARSIAAAASADYLPGGVNLAGGFLIRGLVLDGQPLAVTGAINQTNSFNGFTIVVNEQSSSTDADGGEITVTAIHITENGCMNAKLVTVSAGITVPARTQGGHGGSCPPPRKRC